MHMAEALHVYTDDVRSAEYINTIVLAATLTPRDRSELLLTITRMVQVDQDNALSLLSHSVGVGQHFADVHRAQSTDAAADAPAAQQ